MNQYRKKNRNVKNDIVLLHLCSGDNVCAVPCCVVTVTVQYRWGPSCDACDCCSHCTILYSTVQLCTTTVMVEDPPISFSPFSLADCTLISHFSFDDFVVVAFPDLAGDLDTQI